MKRSTFLLVAGGVVLGGGIALGIVRLADGGASRFALGVLGFLFSGVFSGLGIFGAQLLVERRREHVA